MSVRVILQCKIVSRTYFYKKGIDSRYNFSLLRAKKPLELTFVFVTGCLSLVFAQLFTENWIPACAGMTNAFIFQRFR